MRFITFRHKKRHTFLYNNFISVIEIKSNNNTQFRISRFAVQSGAGGMDRVRLSVEDKEIVGDPLVINMEHV